MFPLHKRGKVSTLLTQVCLVSVSNSRVGSGYGFRCKIDVSYDGCVTQVKTRVNDLFKGRPQ